MQVARSEIQPPVLSTYPEQEVVPGTTVYCTSIVITEDGSVEVECQLADSLDAISEKLEVRHSVPDPHFTFPIPKH